MTNAMRVRIQPKKLPSGKCQVRFEARLNERRSCYGYLLTDADAALGDVMAQLNNKLTDMADKDRFYHDHLYHLDKAKSNKAAQRFWVFEI